MFVSIQEVPKIAREFLAEIILPRATTPLMQFSIGFAMPYVDDAIQMRLAVVQPQLLMLGVIDTSGKVNLDKAKEAALQALEKAGGKLPIANYTADRDDLEDLFKIAQRHATNE